MYLLQVNWAVFVQEEALLLQPVKRNKLLCTYINNLLSCTCMIVYQVVYTLPSDYTCCKVELPYTVKMLIINFCLVMIFQKTKSLKFNLTTTCKLKHISQEINQWFKINFRSENFKPHPFISKMEIFLLYQTKQIC